MIGRRIQGQPQINLEMYKGQPNVYFIQLFKYLILINNKFQNILLSFSCVKLEVRFIIR